MSINPSCDKSEDASEAGDEGKEQGDMVRCEGPLSLAIDDVLDDRVTVLELLAEIGTGEAPRPWGKGIARGEEGVLGVGKGDMRAVADTSGEADDGPPGLLGNENQSQINEWHLHGSFRHKSCKHKK